MPAKANLIPWREPDPDEPFTVHVVPKPEPKRPEKPKHIVSLPDPDEAERDDGKDA